MSQFSYLRPMDESDLLWVNVMESMAYAYPWTERGFELALNDGLCYVLSDADDEPLGYACFLTVVDELHLLNYCISPDYQGQGNGLAGMKALVAQFVGTGYQVILLEVRESNQAAISLYKKCHFVCDGVRPKYYRTDNGKEDAILMSCRFNESESLS